VVQPSVERMHHAVGHKQLILRCDTVRRPQPMALPQMCPTQCLTTVVRPVASSSTRLVIKTRTYMLVCCILLYMMLSSTAAQQRHGCLSSRFDEPITCMTHANVNAAPCSCCSAFQVCHMSAALISMYIYTPKNHKVAQSADEQHQNAQQSSTNFEPTTRPIVAEQMYQL
jgi:hypothetical protein